MDRFSGSDGRRHVVDALQQQQLVRGDSALSQHLAKVATVVRFEKGLPLTVQGSNENDLYLLLSGRVAVVVNGQQMAQRGPGSHIGEMSLIDPVARRSATCLALDDVVAARISEPDFTDLAQREPKLWRNIALVLGERLRQRTAFVREKNETPVLFIGSSTESLTIADALHAGLASTAVVVRVWPHGVFAPSHFPIEDLESELEMADFAALVFGPDDNVISRWSFRRAPRDNVVFETGLFTGALRRQRTLIVKSRGLNLKIPADLAGLTRIEFENGGRADLNVRLGPACTAIAERVRRLGAR